MALSKDEAASILDGTGYSFSQAERQALIDDATADRDVFTRRDHLAATEASARENPNSYPHQVRAMLARAGEVEDSPQLDLLAMAKGFEKTDPEHAKRLRQAVEDATKDDKDTEAAMKDVEAQHAAFRKRFQDGQANVDKLQAKLRTLPRHSMEFQQTERELWEARRRMNQRDSSLEGV